MSGKAKEWPCGLGDRSQDQNGEIRRKRSDTLVRTLRETYGPDFAPGIRSNATLGTEMERSKYPPCPKTSRHRRVRCDS